MSIGIGVSTLVISVGIVYFYKEYKTNGYPRRI